MRIRQVIIPTFTTLVGAWRALPRRRRKHVLVAAACLLPLGGGSILLSRLWSGLHHRHAAPGKRLAAADLLEDPLAVLAGRSPGDRDDTALYSIKPARKRHAAQRARRVPHERVLAVVRDRPPPDLAAPGVLGPDGLPGAAVPYAALAGPLEGTDPAALAGRGTGAFPSPGFPPDGIVFPPDGPFIRGAAVPEPSTWITNLVGLFLTGAALRRSRRSRKRGDQS